MKQLKEITDEILKDKKRSLSWLAGKMQKTFDGLKLSLTKESLKYSDIKLMAEILEVSPADLFDVKQLSESRQNVLEEPETDSYPSLKTELKGCKELVATLKNQIADKEKIIELLNR